MGTTTGALPGAVPETPIWLDVNGRRVAVWSCSPEHVQALALGRLVAEGYFAPGEPLPPVEVVTDAAALGARVHVPAHRAARAEADRRHRREHGCGLAHLVRCEPGAIARRGAPSAIPGDADFPALFRDLFAAEGRSRETGGVHAAALTDGRTLRHRVEEVGRHNAVDKVIGLALLAGDEPAGLGLVLTARISGEIALKAARAGLGWIASRSVPTTLALEIAAAAGIPILGRAAGKEPRLYRPGAGPRPDAGATPHGATSHGAALQGAGGPLASATLPPPARDPNAPGAPAQ
ncbi:MAG TPA: formate dehydrogenase accessory sulfurtransferase FdhD [Longimicrobiales bacterium]